MLKKSELIKFLKQHNEYPIETSKWLITVKHDMTENQFKLVEKISGLEYTGDDWDSRTNEKNHFFIVEYGGTGKSAKSYFSKIKTKLSKIVDFKSTFVSVINVDFYE